MSVIWHDLECGSYAADMRLWQALAREHGDPVLDVGAGTGRISLALARDGHEVTALDNDPELLDELRRRAEGLRVTAMLADARGFSAGRQFALCIVPMQTVQLLGGSSQRLRFLRCAGEHLRDGGVLAIAISPMLELFDTAGGVLAPIPDICERDGILYSSQPTAVRRDGGSYVLERRRETVAPDGARSVSQDVIRLERVTAPVLIREGRRAGLRHTDTTMIPATRDYVGSEVVMLRA